jgi:hypothetical protein
MAATESYDHGDIDAQSVAEGGAHSQQRERCHGRPLRWESSSQLVVEEEPVRSHEHA